MQRKKLFLTIIILVFSLPLLFSQENKLFSFSAGIQSGIPLYNRSSAANQNYVLQMDNYKRIVAGINGEINLNISKPLILLFGTDSFCDFIWKDDFYYNSLDYAFFSGLKIFPDFGGLYASIAYAFGSRTDFFHQPLSEGKQVDSTAWGNGFRISIEYDFLYNKAVKYSPVLGFYYRYMPRGRYSQDHILSAYINIKF